jgi:hypothetical protein
MQPSISRISGGLAGLAVLATAMAGVAAPANAAEISACSDAYQVGGTTVVPDEHGRSALSIKQYWSPRCHQNFAYAYVWQSFRSSHPGTWTVSVGEIWVQSPGVETDGGHRTYSNTRQTDFWSPGFAGGGKCSYADAALFYGSYVTNGQTGQRCG